MTGQKMLGAITTGGLLSAVFAPWSGGLVRYLEHSPVGLWVMFPDGYSDTLLAGITTLVIYILGRLQLRNLPTEKQ